ncbi:MAG: PQQ-binding-like beta-propeller repeat protein [bacterium]
MTFVGAMCCALPLRATAARGADWPHWRGAHYDGTTEAGGLFDRTPIALRVAWSRPLGVAYSGISVAEGRAVTLYADGGTDYVIALDAATGATLWTHAIDSTFPAEGGSEGGAKSVPAIDDGIVYALGPKGHLLALRLADGAELWRLRLDERFGAKTPPFGFATSPLVAGDVLVIEPGGPDGRGVVGLDKRTGELRWATGEDPTDYQSPIVAEIGGVEQLVSVTQSVVSGIDPATGTTLWSQRYETGRVPAPVLLGDDRLLLTGEVRSIAYRVRHTSGRFEVEALWTSDDLKNSYSTPVLHEGFVYGFNGEFLTCVSAEDGREIWKSRPPRGRGLIRVDGHLVILATSGKVVVAEASPQGYREQASIDVLDRASYTYPTFADGRILVRNTRDVAAVTIQEPGAEPSRAGRLRELARSVRIRFLSLVHGAREWIVARLPRHLAPTSSENHALNAIAGRVVERTSAGLLAPVRGARVFRGDDPRNAIRSEVDGHFASGGGPPSPWATRVYASVECGDHAILGASPPVHFRGAAVDVGAIALRGEPRGLTATGHVQRVAELASARRVAAGDVDGDGDDDLVVAVDAASGTSFRLLLADGRGGFSLAPTPVRADARLGGELLALVSSGEAVLAFPTAAPAGFQLILGDGKGSFDDEHPIQASLPDPADRAVLIDAHETAPRVLVSTRDASGRGQLHAWTLEPSDPPQLVHDPFASPIEALAAVDLDGDQRDEVVVALADGTCPILASGGGGALRDTATLACGARPRALAVGFVDRDVQPDILVTSGDAGGASRVTWIEPDGHGGFDARATELGHPVDVLALARLSPLRDAVVLASAPPRALELWVSREPNALVRRDAFPDQDGAANPSPPLVVAGDFDGDGFGDIASLGADGIVTTHLGEVVPGDEDHDGIDDLTELAAGTFCASREPAPAPAVGTPAAAPPAAP